MEIRKYSHFASTRGVSGVIASEVIRYGKSEGWSGNLTDFIEIQEVLSKFNIVYVDDMFGRWAYGKGQLHGKD